MAIRILIADDSPLVRSLLRETVRQADDVEVVGEAADGREAFEMTARLKPDLVLLDLLMPVWDGLKAIEEIMACTPTPVLVLSAATRQSEVDYAFAAVKRGALDVMEKPHLAASPHSEFARLLLEKIRLLAGIRVIHHPRWKAPAKLPAATRGVPRDVLAIGASTGGPKGVMQIVRSLPADFQGAVFIVQHMPGSFVRGFAQWLNDECALPVRLAAEGDAMAAGQVLVAPGECHMTVQEGAVRLLHQPPVNCCLPSIDVFFESLAQEAGGRAVSVLLSGMGKDGARGLLSLKEEGALTMVQEEASCAVFGMPKAAIGLDAVNAVLALDEICAAVQRLFCRL